MATFDTNTTNYATASAANRAARYVGDIIASVIAWNDARVTRNVLSALSDRELDDIGLTRGDIDSVATSTYIR
ncbi:DUF1127 domain-containing protein [Sulfitobacter sp. D35]|uniref:DUF1127 domain-containing protein n=1 Tax=Sulfitobacter sp. D35 TaxID=3083252 RepID=UPI00296F3354|nr:DUF1127 domain-containing protein [Sulfitobacter sp. D35]MDW4499515.1 DUF1127 domain-containing protein [Sulfitobacter sp. D35]